ncbi:MAG: hypothetical protein EON59_11390 [Alphaproteobacteria bacterium]|nr:MAG: hypothetical protein EON59_11390 [Alphaproteobacteria bacterium]
MLLDETVALLVDASVTFCLAVAAHGQEMQENVPKQAVLPPIGIGIGFAAVVLAPALVEALSLLWRYR